MWQVKEKLQVQHTQLPRPRYFTLEYFPLRSCTQCVKSENTYCTIHARKNGKKRRISSSPMMHYICIPFVRKKYSEGCFVDNPARKKLKHEDIEHVNIKVNTRVGKEFSRIEQQPAVQLKVTFQKKYWKCCISTDWYKYNKPLWNLCVHPTQNHLHHHLNGIWL